MRVPGDPVRHALAAALALLAAGPSLVLLARALPALGEGGWLAHYASTTLPGQAWTSLRVALLAAAVAFAAGAVPGVVVARRSFRGRGLVVTLALAPLLVSPSVGAGVWTVGLAGHAWSDAIGGWPLLGLQLGIACGPYLFAVFAIAASRQPAALPEIAAACGLGPFERAWRVHARACTVPAAAGLLIVLAQSLGDFAAAERLGVQTLGVGLHALWFASQSSLVAAIVSTVLVVPALLLVAVAAWAATRLIDQAAAAPAAAASRRRPLPAPAAAALLAWSLLCALPGFGVPEAQLLRWAWLNAHRMRVAALPADAASSLLTAALVVATVLAVCAAVALAMRAGRQSKHAERVPWLFLVNFFLPPLVLALAFVLMSRDGSPGAWLLGEARDTRLLVVAAAALRLMPLAMLPMLDALRRTPPALVEAARACGAGPLHARVTAFAAHLGPALLAGSALVFIESVKELELGLSLQPFGYGALALKIDAFARNQNMDRAAAWVLASQALMLAPLALLAWRMQRLGGAAERG